MKKIKKTTRNKTKALSLAMILVLGCFGVPLSVYAEPAVAVDAAPPAPAQHQNMMVDFQTYQQSLDDFFHIKLSTHPDPDYGINSLIIDLSRKAAENPEDTETMISLGHIYRILGQPREANRFYQKALALKPDNYYLYVFSGVMYLQTKQYPEALEQLDKAVAINPYDTYAWLARGRATLELQNEEETLKSYEKVLEINPGNEEALFILSAYYFNRGEKHKALRLLETLFEKHPKDQYLRFRLGSLYLADNQIDRTLNLWEDLFFEGNRDPQFVFSLAVAYFQKGEYDRAEKILDHLQFLLPHETGIQFLLAEVYRATDRPKKAIQAYHAIMAETPDYLDAYIGLIMVLREQNRTAEAEQVMRQAAGHFGSSELDRLQKMIGHNNQIHPDKDVSDESTE
ncbi:MAG: tetratricopeptide repeat protein [Candidatus Omnitrophica bacterium]|nr:tetratricopeptide repeat protein [Candidatus Omnitrophota bacterium]